MATPAPIYDSASPSPSILQNAHSVWRVRSLLRVLVARDLAVRYKRSVLGVWWTLLNPLLETLVLWMVFSQVFRWATPGVPYIVFVLSGVLVFTCFRQTVLGSAGATLNHRDIISKVRVAPAVFSISTAGANAMTFCFTLVPLALVMAIAGVTPNPAFLLMVPIMALLVAFALGLGLALSPIALRFPDTIDLLTIAVTLIGYLAPVFYPPEIVPERFEIVQHLNPLYHFVTLFRDVLYGHGAGPALSWLAITVSAAAALVIGHSVHTALRRGAFTAL